MLTLVPFPDVFHIKKFVHSKANSVGLNLNHMQVSALGMIESWVYHCTREANRMIEKGEPADRIGNDFLTLRLHFGQRNGHTVLFTALVSTFPEAFVVLQLERNPDTVDLFGEYPVARNSEDPAINGKIVILDTGGYHRHLSLPDDINELFKAGAAGVILS